MGAVGQAASIWGVVVVAALVAIAAIAVFVRNWREAREPAGDPVLVFPAAAPPPPPQTVSPPARRPPHDRPRVARRRETSPDSTRPPEGAAASGGPGADETTATVRLDLRTEDEGPLQLLPGGLEVVEGADSGLEVRFVRLPSGEVPDVTIGRSEGPPNRHVQLRARTVSRMHARIRFRDGRWWIQNLSSTNPAAVNRRELDEGGRGIALSDGDRIRMGEVVMRFRETWS